MIQHWASEGEFYIGGFVLLKFIESVVTDSMNFSNTKSPVYTPGGSWSLKLINVRPRIHAWSNWLEAWHVVHVGYLISQSASCQLAVSKCKSYCASFKVKAVETAEKKSK